VTSGAPVAKAGVVQLSVDKTAALIFEGDNSLVYNFTLSNNTAAAINNILANVNGPNSAVRVELRAAKMLGRTTFRRG
jgi:hypothetical protein